MVIGIGVRMGTKSRVGTGGGDRDRVKSGDRGWR